MKIYFGLDLGTDSVKMTYSYLDKEGHSVSNRLYLDDEISYPAVAFYDENNDIWKFGRVALNGACDSQKPIVKIKEMLLLCDNNDIFNGKEYVNKSCGYCFNAKTWSVKMLCQNFIDYILNDLKNKALKKVNIPDGKFSDEIMVAFPCTATDNYKITLKSMVENAGYSARMIAEPIAAAVCLIDEGTEVGYKNIVIDVGEEKTTMIVFSPYASDGESVNFEKVESLNYGGKDFDKLIYNYAVNCSDSEEEITNYQKFALMESAKRAKEYLCDGDEVVFIEYQSDSVKYIKLTENEFFKMTESLCYDIAGMICDYINLTGRIDHIIFLGGTGKNKFLIRAVKNKLKLFNNDISLSVPKDGAYGIAKGACIHALGIHKFKSITTKSYGFQCYNADRSALGISILINKNAKLPVTSHKKYETLKSNQKYVDIMIRSSDRSGGEEQFIRTLVDSNVLSSGKMILPNYTKSGYEFYVCVTIDSDGIGRVKVGSDDGRCSYKNEFELR